MSTFSRLAACAALAAVCACGSGSSQQTCQGPEAFAGASRAAARHALVTLSGSATKTSGTVTYAWRLDAPPGSAAVLSSASAAAPTFTTDVSGSYVATLFVRDSCGASAPSTSVISVVNRAPVASARADRQPMPGDRVTLDGGGSTDPDQDALQYRWSIVSRPAGSAAALSSTTASAPTFTPDAYGTYVVMLIVSDGEEASEPVDVIVQAGVTGPNGTCPPAPAPVASAGPDQNVSFAFNAHLDGTGSTTGRPLPLAFDWTLSSKPPGSNASIDQPHAARPALVQVDRPGTYVVSLVVNDGCVSSAAATVRITRPNSVPSAFVFAPFQPLPLLVPFSLQGNASDFDSEPLTYRWAIASRPAGSAAAIADPTRLFTTFTPDVEGTYVFSLVVSDAVSSSPPAQGTFVVVNQPPVARAGADQAGRVGVAVTLDGSASSDPSLRPLTFAWTLQGPAGSAAALSDSSAARPTFTPDLTGSYRAQLTVSAGGLSSQATAFVAVWPAVVRLTHRVIDAAYSASLERVITVAADPSALYLLDPRAPAETTVALSSVPTSLAVDPDGRFAAVGHANEVSYVDLQARSVVRVLAVQGQIASAVLGDAGFLFGFPLTLSGEHVRLLSMPVAGGSSSLIVSSLVGAGRGRFRRANGTLYLASNPGSFNNGFGIEEYAVGSGTPTAITPAAGANLGTCGDIWLSEDASRLFTRCGNVFRASSSSSDDLSAAGTLARPSGVALLLRHLSDSRAAGEVSAVASANDPFAFSPPDDGTLRRWAADGLTQRESLVLPTEVAGAGTVRWLGRFVFYRSDGSERYVLMQLDPAAGALQDFGYVVF